LESRLKASKDPLTDLDSTRAQRERADWMPPTLPPPPQRTEDFVSCAGSADTGHARTWPEGNARERVASLHVGIGPPRRRTDQPGSPRVMSYIEAPPSDPDTETLCFAATLWPFDIAADFQMRAAPWPHNAGDTVYTPSSARVQGPSGTPYSLHLRNRRHRHHRARRPSEHDHRYDGRQC